VTHGTAEPYSNRSTRSSRIATYPLRPSTILTSEELPELAVMKSISATLPPGVSNTVSRISVPGRYCRRTCTGCSIGAIRQ
jgi:hypothetical protein